MWLYATLLQKTPQNPTLDQQRQSRSLGELRQDEFQQRGQSPGIPRTAAPPLTGGPAGMRTGAKLDQNSGVEMYLTYRPMLQE
ncbi:MAG TPA: hypothetical protein VIY49_13070 [Bryobacteraceae bacterium]